jgi:hypothetical protein
MNHRTRLYLTVGSLALLSGCGNTQNSDNQTTVKPSTSQPSMQSPASNLDKILESDATPTSEQADEQQLKANVYIYNSLLPKPTTKVSLTDSAYFMTLTSYLHWNENQKILNIPGSTPHSVKTTENLSKMPDAERATTVFIDAWGDSAQNKADFTLSSSATVSVMDVIDADLTILKDGNLTTLALRLENANVSIISNGRLTTHALYVGANSTINYGQNITYVPDKLDQFGLTMNQLNVHKHKRFPWATEGEFMVAGRVDHLKVTPGVTLYTQGNAANFTTIEHQGGTIELTSSAPFKTNEYRVSAPDGVLNVVWDTASTQPLMHTDYATISSPVSVTLSELSNSIKPGDSIVLIECKRNALTSFKPINQNTFGATLDLSNNTDETTNVSRLTLKLTGKGLSSTGLSHTETKIANQILNQDAENGTLTMALLDADAAAEGLHNISQGTYLSGIRSTPFSFDGLRDGNAYTCDAGIIQARDETGIATQTTTGASVSENVRFGFSVIQPTIAQQNPQSNIGAVHGQYQQFGVDAFSSLDGNLTGGTLGVYFGNVQDGYAAISVSAQNQGRHGSANTVFGHLSVDVLNETHVFCNVTLKKTFQNIGVSAQFFTEMYAARAAYSARLNSSNLPIPAEMLPLSYGAHVQTTYAFDKGYTSVGFGLNHDSFGFSPSMSLQMSLSL